MNVTDETGIKVGAGGGAKKKTEGVRGKSKRNYKRRSLQQLYMK